MSGPLVSVCIPAYRRPEELRIAVKSVLNQDFADLEVVVSDDSGDLEDVVRAIDDDRIRYLRNPHRLGMAGNWNVALNSARGRLIGLLMDDDWILPGFVATAVSCFADHRLGIVFTNHYFQRRNRLLERDCALPEGRYDDFLFLLLKHKPVAVSAALMRREVWEQMRPLPDLLAADLVMHIRAALAGWPFYYVAKPLMAYRVHEGQLSAREGRFRDHVVHAWELFEFADPTCEALRRKHLARALASRAATYLKLSQPESADADLTRAESLDASCFGARERALKYLAGHRALSAAVLPGWSQWARLRRLIENRVRRQYGRANGVLTLPTDHKAPRTRRA